MTGSVAEQKWLIRRERDDDGTFRASHGWVVTAPSGARRWFFTWTMLVGSVGFFVAGEQNPELRRDCPQLFDAGIPMAPQLQIRSLPLSRHMALADLKVGDLFTLVVDQWGRDRRIMKVTRADGDSVTAVVADPSTIRDIEAWPPLIQLDTNPA